MEKHLCMVLTKQMKGHAPGCHTKSGETDGLFTCLLGIEFLRVGGKLRPKEGMIRVEG